MRKLKYFGERLRERLGALSDDGHEERRKLMDKPTSRMRVGIHMRISEDYVTWHGGAYHFNILDYMSVIKRLENEAGERSCDFFLFSDKNIESSLSQSNEIKFFRSTEINDMIALGKCDVVVGPPSTFGTWSAFLGGSKRVVLTRKSLGDTSIPLLSSARTVDFPTGAYLPDDVQGGPI